MVLVSAVGLTGCFDFGLSGDSTRGERGVSDWSISDGLCPGLAGDCALDVPLALGASATLEVRVRDRALAGLTVRGEGAVSVSGYEIHSSDSDGDGEPDYEPYARFTVESASAGAGALVLEDASGDELDRVSMTVRTATQLTCGSIAEGENVDWQMTHLDASERLSLRMAPVDEAVQIACRATDESGEPMLTVRAIEWEVIAGTDSVGLLEDWLSEGLVTTVVHGARVHAHTLAPGSATVRATLGDASADVAIEVTE
jgi:hypothetical protein